MRHKWKYFPISQPNQPPLRPTGLLETQLVDTWNNWINANPTKSTHIITWSMKPQLNWCTQPLIGAHNHHFDTTPTKSMQTQSQNAINLCSLGNNHKIASCKPSHPRTLLMTALTTKFVCVSMCNKREGRGFLSAKREKWNDFYVLENILLKIFWQNILQLLHSIFLIHKKCFQLWPRFYSPKKKKRL